MEWKSTNHKLSRSSPFPSVVHSLPLRLGVGGLFLVLHLDVLPRLLCGALFSTPLGRPGPPLASAPGGSPRVPTLTVPVALATDGAQIGVWHLEGFDVAVLEVVIPLDELHVRVLLVLVLLIQFFLQFHLLLHVAEPVPVLLLLKLHLRSFLLQNLVVSPLREVVDVLVRPALKPAEQLLFYLPVYVGSHLGLRLSLPLHLLLPGGHGHQLGPHLER
mmetsp:Transcript_9167/g.27799  ORF Transcript_9167/g.27799 Transcript_9167/m.27799 type:complete len:217 (-) Transcript_9167:643-1293(-)